MIFLVIQTWCLFSIRCQYICIHPKITAKPILKPSQNIYDTYARAVYSLETNGVFDRLLPDFTQI